MYEMPMYEMPGDEKGTEQVLTGDQQPKANAQIRDTNAGNDERRGEAEFTRANK